MKDHSYMRREEVCGHENTTSLRAYIIPIILNATWGSIIDTANRVWAGWSGVQTLV